MSTITDIFSSASARDASKPASSNTGLVVFRSDTKAIEVSDGTSYYRYNNDGISVPSVNNVFSGSFDGTDDYIEVGNITNLNSGTNFTISVWFNRPSAREDMLLGGASPLVTGIGMYPWSDGNFYVHLGTNGLLNATLPGENQWINATVTYDSSGSSILYFNGAVAASQSSSAVSSTAGNTFRIGNFTADSSGRDFLGNIDEVAIWDSTTLDASNVGQIYNAGTPINLASNAGNYTQSSNLTHWYRLGDNASDTGSGGVSNGNTITNIENAANPGTNDGSTINGTPSFSTSVPS
jgi:hypothetical protein